MEIYENVKQTSLKTVPNKHKNGLWKSKIGFSKCMVICFFYFYYVKQIRSIDIYLFYHLRLTSQIWDNMIYLIKSVDYSPFHNNYLGQLSDSTFHADSSISQLLTNEQTKIFSLKPFLGILLSWESKITLHVLSASFVIFGCISNQKLSDVANLK